MSDQTDLDVTPAANERSTDRLAQIAAGPTGMRLQTMADYWTMATSIVRAGMAPLLNAKTGERMSPAQVMIAIQMGAEVGLPPMTALKNVAVIRGKPTIWGDALLALAFRRGLIENIDEQVMGEGDQRTAVCTVERKGMTNPVVRTFSVADAKKANLWGNAGPWSNYPDRMLAMRARGFALRDAVPDALGGFMLTEEVMDMPPEVDEPATRTDAMLAALTPTTEADDG